MNSYRKGRAKEWKTIKLLQNQGWVCLRSAGSHSPIDIIAAKNGEVKLIQVKSKPYLPSSERRALETWKKAFNIAFAEIWIWEKWKKKPMIKKV